MVVGQFATHSSDFILNLHSDSCASFSIQQRLVSVCVLHFEKDNFSNYDRNEHAISAYFEHKLSMFYKPSASKNYSFRKNNINLKCRCSITLKTSNFFREYLSKKRIILLFETVRKAWTSHINIYFKIYLQTNFDAYSTVFLLHFSFDLIMPAYIE